MGKIYFITGNINKFNEAKSIIPEIEQIDFDLQEIQELDARKIIEEKLNEAIKNNSGTFFCEDTSLYINCLNGLPGPLIKWFLEALGNKGIFDLISKYENKSAYAKTIVGYVEDGKITFFEGQINGKIVEPKTETSTLSSNLEGKFDKENRRLSLFGWDPIFQPEGCKKTFEEMSFEEKNKISMRKQALIKLKNYLKENEN